MHQQAALRRTKTGVTIIIFNFKRSLFAFHSSNFATQLVAESNPIVISRVIGSSE
jgi:hypothetical protein